MKYTFFISAFLLFFNLNCFCQIDKKIVESWKEVKENIGFKTEVVLELTAKLQKSSKINKAELSKIASNAKDLKIECNKKDALNEQVVKDLKLKNDNLNTCLVRALVNIELDSKLRSDEELFFIKDELSVAENNIFSKIKNYNKICLSLNKKKLIYEISSDSKSPQVEF